MHSAREELMEYRLEMAREKLKASKLLLDNGAFKDSIGRSYSDFFIVSHEDAEEQYSRAVEFITAVEAYLKTKRDK